MIVLAVVSAARVDKTGVDAIMNGFVPSLDKPKVCNGHSICVCSSLELSSDL